MADLSIFIFAFGGGIVSFLSPCNAALLPTFLSYIGSSSKNFKQSTFMSVIFAIGYSLTFAIIGLILNSVSNFIKSIKYINIVSGIIMILLSLYLLFSKNLMNKKFLKIRNKKEEEKKNNKIINETENSDLIEPKNDSTKNLEKKDEKSFITKHSGYSGAFLLGLSLGSAFIPCVTPVYASILTMSLQYSSITIMYMMLLYALGLTLPFIIFGAIMGKITSRFIVKIIKYGSILQKVFSLVLLWIGIEIILTGLGYNGILGII